MLEALVEGDSAGFAGFRTGGATARVREDFEGGHVRPASPVRGCSKFAPSSPGLNMGGGARG